MAGEIKGHHPGCNCPKCEAHRAKSVKLGEAISKLANEVPELRRHLVPLLRKHADLLCPKTQKWDSEKGHCVPKPQKAYHPDATPPAPKQAGRKDPAAAPYEQISEDGKSYMVDGIWMDKSEADSILRNEAKNKKLRKNDDV